MPKEIISATIETYLMHQFRLTVPQRERSKLIENFIKNFLEVNEVFEDEQEILELIQEQKNEQKKINETLANLSAKLSKLNSDRSKSEKVKVANEKIMSLRSKAMKDSGIIRNMVE